MQYGKIYSGIRKYKRRANYCGDSYVLSFVSGFFSVVTLVIFTKKHKILTKEELKFYIDQL
jgi:hypothetical protein